jgi:hypothetical protein
MESDSGLEHVQEFLGDRQKILKRLLPVETAPKLKKGQKASVLAMSI